MTPNYEFGGVAMDGGSTGVVPFLLGAKALLMPLDILAAPLNDDRIPPPYATLCAWFLRVAGKVQGVSAVLKAACFEGYCQNLAGNMEFPPALKYAFISPNNGTICVDVEAAMKLPGFDSALIPTGVPEGNADAEEVAFGVAFANAGGIQAALFERHAARIETARQEVLQELGGNEAGIVVYDTGVGGSAPSGENTISVQRPFVEYDGVPPVSDAYGLLIALPPILTRTELMRKNYLIPGDVSADYYSTRVTLHQITFVGDWNVTTEDNGIRYETPNSLVATSTFGALSLSEYSDGRLYSSGEWVPIPASYWPLSPKAIVYDPSFFSPWRGLFKIVGDISGGGVASDIQREQWILKPPGDPLVIPGAKSYLTPLIPPNFPPLSPPGTLGCIVDCATQRVAYFSVSASNSAVEQLRLAHRNKYSIPVSDPTRDEQIQAARDAIDARINVVFNSGIPQDWITFGAAGNELRTVMFE
jgi:hypothetical protein